MEKKTLIKEKTIIEAQKYELDKEPIKKFYGIKEKIENDYNIIEKKIIFSKENSITKIDKKLKFSHFQTFRSLLLSEFNLEEMKEEFENANQLITYSQNLRKYIASQLNISSTSFNENLSTQAEEKNQKPKKLKNVIHTVMFADDFLKKCKLLKLKQNPQPPPKEKSTFRIFSDLEKKSDIYSIKINNKNLNLQFYHQKNKILQCYNREYLLTNYISKIRDGLIKTTPDSLPQVTKDKFSSEMIDALFDPRTEANFAKIDAFYAQFNRQIISLQEKDLYKKIYAILCKNNYMNFLSFLYSKNSLFKFIYDEFSDKDAVVDTFDLDVENGGENRAMNEFKETKEITHIGTKEFVNVNNNSDEINTSNASFLPWRQRHSTVYIKKNIDLYEQMAGCYSFLKIGIITEIIRAKIVEEFFCDDENQTRDFIEMDFFGFLDKCSKTEFNYALLISKDKKLKIFTPNTTMKFVGIMPGINNARTNTSNDNCISENFSECFNIEENMSNVVFYQITTNELSYKLDPKVIKTIYEDKVNSNPLYPSSFAFYLIKINDNVNDSYYYLFKIEEKYAENFGNILQKKFSLKDCSRLRRDCLKKKESKKKIVEIPPPNESEVIEEGEYHEDSNTDFKNRDIAEQPDYIDEVKEIIRESNSVGVDSMKGKSKNKLFPGINDTFNNENNDYNNKPTPQKGINIKDIEDELKGITINNNNNNSDNEGMNDEKIDDRDYIGLMPGHNYHANNGVNQASILNSSSVSDTSNASGVKTVIKESNAKKTEAFQVRNKD